MKNLISGFKDGMENLLEQHITKMGNRLLDIPILYPIVVILYQVDLQKRKSTKQGNLIFQVRTLSTFVDF